MSQEFILGMVVGALLLWGWQRTFGGRGAVKTAQVERPPLPVLEQADRTLEKIDETLRDNRR